ncbi:hypothetical protein CONLIGDRAFT_435880 [Coniochaeta ligniaria NRRL 30616]|uniref:Uncharacterized protein n=1 Tax=Coniochaeta ligniaria NRRL 30616 TaxID=1408157 RepID=A0A1J7JE61_9PEZI|nr:hypothetical protein CONLIGDRAFT_435880 [Coniochaeta ligniaria NRRL 30616]
MEPLKSTTARLRRTFAYPTDDSTASNSPEALDEDEQETLIATLATQNETRNAQFRHLLFALPTLSSIPYLISLATIRHPQSALLALTSLASTAWLLYYLPPAETGISYLDSLGSSPRHAVRAGILSSSDEDDDTTALRRSRTSRRRRASSFSVAAHAGLHRTPLETWLPYLNLGLCGVLFVIGILKSAKNGGGSLIADLLPGVVYAVVLAAKMVMGGVDPEGELGGLRYEFKGA